MDAILKQPAKVDRHEPDEFSARGLHSGYLTEAAGRGIPLPEAMGAIQTSIRSADI